MGHEEAQHDEVVRALPPDDLDQTPNFDPADPEPTPDDLDESPEFDPTNPEPIPEDVFDQRWGA